jgi:hypothetical protein
VGRIDQKSYTICCFLSIKVVFHVKDTTKSRKPMYEDKTKTNVCIRYSCTGHSKEGKIK